MSTPVLLRRLFLLAAGLAALALAPSALAGTCGLGSYAYAGLGSRAAASGVGATITPTAASSVRDGHVAGWVGVGGAEERLWMQIGFSAFHGDATSRIYVEISRPGHARVYRELRTDVAAGEPHRFMVLELRNRPGWWRAWLDGAPVTAPVLLPESHGRLTAQALGESWSGATGGSCNLFSYGFGDVAVTTGGAWQPLRNADLFQDANYRLTRQSPTSFSAGSVTPAARTAAVATP